MSLRVVITSHALHDLTQAADFIARDSVDAADRFVRSAFATFDFLADNPGVGVRYRSRSTRLRDIRRWFVQGFPNHLIFYRPTKASLRIAGIIHGSRDLDALLRYRRP